MVGAISLDDQKEWDDSALIASWDAAVSEYEKYHSIAKSGKRLEDILSEDELNQLREEYGDVLDEDEIVPGAADPNNSAGPVGSEQPQPGQSQSDNGQGEGIENATELATPGNQEDSGAAETKLPHQDSIPESIPQAILGTVQDEKLKNLLMSWYYAGYYTGLYTGQQPGSNSGGPAE